MKKTITIICLILSGLIILDSMNAGHVLFMFLLAGVVPGTSISISANDMMSLFAFLIGIILGRLTSRAVIYLSHRKTMPTTA